MSSIRRLLGSSRRSCQGFCYMYVCPSVASLWLHQRAKVVAPCAFRTAQAQVEVSVFFTLWIVAASWHADGRSFLGPTPSPAPSPVHPFAYQSSGAKAPMACRVAFVAIRRAPLMSRCIGEAPSGGPWSTMSRTPTHAGTGPPSMRSRVGVTTDLTDKPLIAPHGHAVVQPLLPGARRGRQRA